MTAPDNAVGSMRRADPPNRAEVWSPKVARRKAKQAAARASRCPHANATTDQMSAYRTRLRGRTDPASNLLRSWNGASLSAPGARGGFSARRWLEGHAASYNFINYNDLDRQRVWPNAAASLCEDG